MFIRNILLLVILAISPFQAYGMDNTLKRKADESLEQTITKEMRVESTDPQLIFFDVIKDSINRFDSVALNRFTSLDNAPQLSEEQKKQLHSTAKKLKKNIIQMQKMGSNIIAQTDDADVKTKFSFDTEYKKLQEICRNLSAFKTLPSLAFPQVIFTQAPFCEFTLDKRTQPDQCFIALIKNEQTAIRLCCFHITLESIAKALIKKMKQGVPVEIITNQKQGNKENDDQIIKTLIESGIAVLSPQKNSYEMMHHKFCLFDCNIGDKNLLWTGSYNPTPYTNRNSWDDVNILDHKTMIKQYSERFEEVKNRSSKFNISTPQTQQPQTNALPTPKQLTNNSNHNPQPQQHAPTGSLPQTQQPSAQLNPVQKTVPLLPSNVTSATK